MTCNIGNHRWAEKSLRVRKAECEGIAKSLNEAIRNDCWHLAEQNCLELLRKIQTQIDQEREINS